MTTNRQSRSRPAEPAAKLGTRAQLLEAAGELFAERGYDAVTGREICLKAGANAAAINYHFGGMEGLYVSVLEEARERFVSQHALVEALARAGTMEEKMTAVARIGLRALLGSEQKSWAPRLIIRELTSPSAAASLLVATAQPRFKVLRAMVCVATGLPEDHPAISRCCLTLAAPMQFLMIADHAFLRRIYPDLDLSAGGIDVLAEHFVRYAMAGLKAVAEAEKEAEAARG
jgi:AcrR family transcriptional regulator